MKIKLQKSTFAFWHTCPTFLGVLRGPNAPSRSSGAVGALFAPKSHKLHFVIRVRRFLMFLGSRNASWALKTRFGATFALRTLKTIKKRRTRMPKERDHQIPRTFSSKVLLGSTWGTLGPAGAEAGWLAAEGSELRAEGSRLGPPPAAATPSPQQSHPPAAQPPPLLSPKVGILVCFAYRKSPTLRCLTLG